MRSTNKVVYWGRLTAREDHVNLGRQVSLALLLGVLTITASFAEETEAPGKAGGAALAAGGPVRASDKSIATDKGAPSDSPKGTNKVAPANGQPAKVGSELGNAPSGGKDAGATAGAGGPPVDKSLAADKGATSGGLKGTNTAAPSSAWQSQTGKNAIPPGSAAAPTNDASRSKKAGGDQQAMPAGGKASSTSGAGDAKVRGNSHDATDKGASRNSRSGGPRGPSAAVPTSGRQNQSGKPAASPTGGTNASPIDLSGGLPRSKDRSQELHQKVQEMAKQVSDLGKKVANAARTPAQPTIAPAANAAKITGSLNAAGKPMTAGQQVPSLGAPATATSVPSGVNAASHPPAGHNLNAAAITGTGMAHPGAGPGTIGGSTKPVVGVNGSTIRAKH